MAIQTTRDQLAETIDAFRTQLRQAGDGVRAQFLAETRLVEAFRTEAQIRQFSLTVDEPPSLGGTDQGPNPVELVLAALGTCQEIVYATYARLLDIPIESIAVRVEGSLDPRGFFGVAEVPAGFDQVRYVVEIQSPAPAERIRELITMVNAHCPVLDILQRPIPVTGDYRLDGVPLAVETNPA